MLKILNKDISKGLPSFFLSCFFGTACHNYVTFTSDLNLVAEIGNANDDPEDGSKENLLDKAIDEGLLLNRAKTQFSDKDA